MKTRTGIVLAAGAAARLPNKALLPIAGDRICIESALGWLARQERVSKIVVVVNTSGIVPAVLDMRGWRGRLEYVVQPRMLGVVDAIARCAPLVKDDAVVTFCDNVYDGMDAPGVVPPPLASVIQGTKVEDQLDWYDPSSSQWRLRGGHETPQWYFAGWMVVPRAVAELGMPHQALVKFMNEHGFVPLRRERGSWTDIGTPTSYRRYLDDQS